MTFLGCTCTLRCHRAGTKVKDSLPEYEQYFNGGATKFTINQSGRFWKANIEFIKASKEIMLDSILFQPVQIIWDIFRASNKSFVEGQFNQQKDECKQTGLPELYSKKDC